jgi:hypothetical protein
MLLCFGTLEAASTSMPTVVVVLAGQNARGSGFLESQLTEARDRVLPVVPMFRPPHQAHEVIPAVIGRLNAIPWDGSGMAEMAILRLLGLVEAERRLFLSYSRAASSELALQLRTKLSELRYDVFLDRFSVNPGDDFQRRIDIELADKAFVLLLESEAAVDSGWVQHEVTYALSHNIGLLAVTMPDVRPGHRNEVIDDAFRLVLKPVDLVRKRQRKDPVLRDDCLGRILYEVECAYARALRRRRALLLASASDLLREAGYERQPVDDWAYLATRDKDHVVVLVTPTTPSPRELHRADGIRRRVDSALGKGTVDRAVVLHEAPNQDDEGRALVEWIAEDRPLRTASVADFAGLL